MSNHHWVCFPCRASVRRPGASRDVRCPSCGLQCNNLGYKVPVPPRAKVAVWKALETEYFARRRAFSAVSRYRSVRKKHDLEKEIRKIEALQDNEGRQSLLKQLKSELETVALRSL